jgi:exopolyphosphatase/guanosine-5'-triphosphate,3'-diphosphate pyrophosphatase
MRLACIDIGSNTTRLLVADCDGPVLKPLHQERAFTQIGRDLRASGSISATKIAEVVGVTAAQLGRAEELGTREVRIVATAAIRRAANGAALAAAIERHCGRPVRILSGEEEARLAFQGAALTLGRPAQQPLAVVDVGGGSCELAIGRSDAAPSWSVSLPLGSGELTDAHLSRDPPTSEDLAAAAREARTALAGITPPDPGPAEAVAVGGSATSLSRLVGPVLEEKSFDRALSLLAAAPSQIVAREQQLDPERVRLLPAGLLILRAVSVRLGVPLTIGRGGVREGVLLEAGR